jgi:hypothetical protein
MRGWKHDESPVAGVPFGFWPWGPGKQPVHAAAGVLSASGPGPGNEANVSLLLLGVRFLAPEPMVRNQLDDMLQACARYGVSLTIGPVIPEPDRACASVAISLTQVITARALGGPGLEDALLLLQTAHLELALQCQREAAGNETGVTGYPAFCPNNRPR